jgi:hypothetical protein
MLVQLQTERIRTLRVFPVTFLCFATPLLVRLDDVDHVNNESMIAKTSNHINDLSTAIRNFLSQTECWLRPALEELWRHMQGSTLNRLRRRQSSPWLDQIFGPSHGFKSGFKS